MTEATGEPSLRVTTFSDDALGDLDSVGVASAIATGDISAIEAVEAAIARAALADPRLNAIVLSDFDRARRVAATAPTGVFAGVPTFIKDNTDVAGLATRHGSQAITASAPQPTNEPFIDQFLSTGAINLGKSSLPEFGFNATTEFEGWPPTRNPWNTDHSSGASSGGAAALVAAGVVPFAHANDGGGSIRIPAAACGLVGLKMTRGRELLSNTARSLPVNIVSNGIVSRSVRDAAVFVDAVERYQLNPRLPRVGLVTGPSSRRLEIGVIVDSITEQPTDAQTRAAVEATATRLRDMGHRIREVAVPVDREFLEAFVHYWGLLGFAMHHFGARLLHTPYNRSRNDALTKGLARSFRRRPWRTPGAIAALKRSTAVYRRSFRDVDVVVSPVVSHTTPELGYLSPAAGFDVMFERLVNYVAFTPANNAAGGPAISLPLARTANDMPLGLQLSADLGNERTLLELAFELEESQAFERL